MARSGYCRRPFVLFSMVTALICLNDCGGGGVVYVMGIASKCSACQQIAMQKYSKSKQVASRLYERIRDEKPRNHLDLRGRLDSHGNRQGRVIAYKESELRGHDLLDGLCDVMTGYELKVVKDEEGGAKAWTRKADHSGRPVTAKVGRRREDMQLYCDSLLEEYEDDLIEAIRQGELDNTESDRDASHVLCEALSRDCLQKSRKKDKKTKKKSLSATTPEPEIDSSPEL